MSDGMKHTPGPWELSRGAQADAYAVEAATKTVAHVKHAGFSSFPNARLIAAAPELLEAAQEFMEYHDEFISVYPSRKGDPDHEELATALRAAIAKATR